ncbi:hypothetical protein ACQKE4_08030 [Halomonas sp. NPDC076908]|uniref:hypothetical protein n=1 Tax=Halomonas sp. NPDC076908 TaxID=3390567 RepID=UPI003D062406
MMAVYPLVGLYVIALGGIWASRLGHLSQGVGLMLAYVSLLAAAFLVGEILLTVFELMGEIHIGLWANLLFASVFGMWALVHETFLKPKGQ